MDTVSKFWSNVAMNKTKLFALLRILSIVSVAFAAAPYTIRALQTVKTVTIGILGTTDSDTSRGIALAIERYGGAIGLTATDGTVYRINTVYQPIVNNQLDAALKALRDEGAIAIFGPDEGSQLSDAAIAALEKTGVPVLSAAVAPSASFKGDLLRTRADDSRLMAGLVDYLTRDLARNKVALFRAAPATDTRAADLIASLNSIPQKPVASLDSTSGTPTDWAKALLNTQPDTIIVVGAPEQAAGLLQALRTAGFGGSFVYPDATSSTFIAGLMPELRAGIIGVTNWIPALTTRASQDFLTAYVSMFNLVPTGISAAAYDAAGAVMAALRNSAVQPTVLARALRAFPKTLSVQGYYDPAIGRNGLSADVVVFTTGIYGEPIPEAQYAENGRVSVSVTLVPPTLQPSLTRIPTRGPVVATANELSNVHSGPSTDFPLLGELRAGESANVQGTNVDATWLAITFADRPGWVRADRVSISGSVQTLPIIAVTPPAPTVTPIPYARLRVLNAVINPAIVQQGVPFTVTLTVANTGTQAAGQFAIAASFLPGNVYVAAIVNGLAPGQTTSVNLTATVRGGVGLFTTVIVVDLNNQVNQGPNAGNRKFPFTYRVQ